MSQSDLYFCVRKDSYLVVSFRGNLDLGAMVDLERCKSEIDEQEDVRALILHFAGVKDVTFDAIPALTRIQASARARGMVLRLSGLDPELADKLHKRGVLRRQEAVNDIKDAILMIAKLTVPREMDKKAV